MAQERMTLEDWLDDLCVRFILTLPQEDLTDVARICFAIEEAQWFYEDFIRPMEPHLPSLSLKLFSLKMFQHCPLFASYSPEQHLAAFEGFLQYKVRIPVRGAILLNSALDSAVLVRGYKKGATWSYPRGKINNNEDDLDCAVREVYEETGYDLNETGLVAHNTPVPFVELNMKDQHIRLYVFRDVPEDANFEPKTRKEIGDIAWYKLSDLPGYRKKKGQAATGQGRFFMVAPLMSQLRNLISKMKKQDAQNSTDGAAQGQPYNDEGFTEDNVWQHPTEINPKSTTNADAAIVALAQQTAEQDFADQASQSLLRSLHGAQPVPNAQATEPEPDPEASGQAAGQALLSILQRPALAAPTDFAGTPKAHPQTPLDHTTANPSQPQPPHHQHSANTGPLPAYGQPPPFPMADYANDQHARQRQSRPEVQFSTDAHGQANVQVSAHHFPNRPLNILQPRPLQPNIQENQLMRGMMPSPMSANALGSAPHGQPGSGAQGWPGGLAGPEQANHQHQMGSHPGGQGGNAASSQPSAHAMGLLNVLKGPRTPSTGPPGGAQPGHTTAQQHTFISSTTHNVGGKATEEAVKVVSEEKTVSSVPVENAAARGQQPSASHRSNLLDLLKNTSSPAPTSRAAGIPNQPSPAATKAAPVTAPSQSLVDQLRSTGQASGQAPQMNPETNLPYGARSILPRPQQQQQQQQQQQRVPSSNEDDLARKLALLQGFSKASPSPHAPQSGSPKQQQPRVPSRAEAGRQPSSPLSRGSLPSISQGYPYSWAGQQQASGHEAAAMSSPPASSTLPFPSGLKPKPRQNSTAEQKSMLLSMFKDKSAEAMAGSNNYAVGDSARYSPRPRSRLASVTSNGDQGMSQVPGQVPVRSIPSRQGSQTPISPANEKFLMNFLRGSSDKTARNA